MCLLSVCYMRAWCPALATAYLPHIDSVPRTCEERAGKMLISRLLPQSCNATLCLSPSIPCLIQKATLCVSCNSYLFFFSQDSEVVDLSTGGVRKPVRHAQYVVPAMWCGVAWCDVVCM